MDEIAERLACRLLGDHAGENVIGVRVEIALAHRQLIGGAWIGGIRQLLQGESPHRLVCPRLGHPLGLGIGGNAARHVEEVADGDVLPRRIFRQPLAERVVDRELARSFELQDHRCGERLRRASHLVKRVLVDWPRVWVAANLAGKGLDRRPGSAEADVSGDAGDLFDRRTRRKPRVKRSLNSLDLGRLGSKRGRRKGNHNRSGQSRNESVLHVLPLRRDAYEILIRPPPASPRKHTQSRTSSCRRADCAASRRDFRNPD